ncbi:class I SAM-dependent methyltransferase [Methylobacterium gossipiicola]|uniref:Methyltransferase domain-containing protein n=1 Tax=Methylobacterium gossipiicola TaxID=582675 RepID=A0A1I2XP75_9HYPH|nr:class I SAM-dependent methyltransferase [Methylobacterium gossipiicola]SFH15293.1 hypothetical protein SAMN05192565_1583 [Methylobacterium gossipiicola]
MTANFEKRTASIQNSFDIFSGQWCSDVPIYGGGNAQLFFDARIRLFDEAIGGFAGKKVLELGPLEAGHTYAMTLFGASEIVAVEANRDAFLRCLVVKEAFNLNARFLCGDFERYMGNKPPKVDVVLASGVLYHMKDPLSLIESICNTAEQACFWTHYYDKELIDNNEHLRPKFAPPETLRFKGRTILASKQSYLTDIERTDFAGGMEGYSYWLSLEGLSEAFEALGFKMTIHDMQRDHPHGAGVTFTVKRCK